MKRAPRGLHSLVTNCGKSPAEAHRHRTKARCPRRRQPIDGRHLGCGGSRCSSRSSGGSGPRPRCRVARATRRRPARAGSTGAHEPALARAGGSCDGSVRVGASASAGRRRTVPDIQPVSRRSCDERCPGGSGWGEALVSGRRRRDAAGDRDPLRRGPRRKAREGSAPREARGAAPALPAGPWLGTSWQVPGGRPFKAREGSGGTEAPASPDSAVDVTDGTSIPSVQRELGKSGRRGRAGIGWFVVVLAGCSGCKLDERSSRVGVLVPAKRPSLTRRRRRGYLAIVNASEAERRSSSGAYATEDVRGGAACSPSADKAAGGRHGAEEPSIEAPPGTRGARTRRWRRGSRPGEAGREGCSEAEAGASPSSEASPGGSPPGIGQRAGCS